MAKKEAPEGGGREGSGIQRCDARGSHDDRKFGAGGLMGHDGFVLSKVVPTVNRGVVTGCR